MNESKGTTTPGISSDGVAEMISHALVSKSLRHYLNIVYRPFRDKQGGIGVANMKRTTELFSGKFNVFASAGNGGEILVDIPLVSVSRSNSV